MKQKAKVKMATAAFLDTIRKASLTLGGLPASERNQMLIEQAVSSWAMIPLELVSSIDELQGLAKKLDRVANDLITRDFNDILTDLDSIYRYLIKGTCKRLSQFKADLQSISSLMILIGPVKTELVRFIEHEDICCLTHVSTWLRYLSKLTFEVDYLKEEALDSFLKTEERLGELCFEKDPIVDALNQIMKQWLTGLDLKVLPCRHGPGSVAEGALSTVEKYKSLRFDKLLRKCTTGWYNSPVPLEKYYPFGLSGIKILDRTSKVLFVPKNAKKLRTICMEPSTLQYFQQGVRRVVSDFLANHEFLSTRINLRRQKQNKDLAKIGSVGNSYATVDLTAASDSVSWNLVRRIFKNTPLMRWMLATRSKNCLLPNGKIIASKKYAPMGSALCFPIQCLVFSAAIEYVARNRGFMHSSLNVTWSVYGDDLIVPTEWYEDLLEVLTHLGFLLNRDKSYHDGPFRESCGGEYYKGVDVTPLYYRLDPIGRSLTERDYIGMCSAANLAFTHGYTYLRASFIDKCLYMDKRGLKANMPSIPCFADTDDHSPLIFSVNPSNFNLLSSGFRQYGFDDLSVPNYQLCEVRYLTVSSTEEKQSTRIDKETILYHEYLMERDYQPIQSIEEFLEHEVYSKSVVLRRSTWSVGWHPVV